MTASGVLSSLMVISALYLTGRGWKRRLLFSAAAPLALGVGWLLLGSLIGPIGSLFALVSYIALAVSNPPLRRSEGDSDSDGVVAFE